MLRPIRFGLMMGLGLCKPIKFSSMISPSAYWLIRFGFNQIQIHVEEACLVFRFGFKCRFGPGFKPTTNQH